MCSNPYIPFYTNYNMDTITKSKNYLIGAEKTQAQQLEDEICAFCPKLSYSQRVTGFISCWLGGYLISFGSTLTLLGPSDKKMQNFGALYAIGERAATNTQLNNS